MKITKKILTSLATVSLLSAGAITAASCSNGQSVKHIEAAKTDVSIVGNGKYTYFEFTLNESFDSSKYELISDCDGAILDDFSFGGTIVEHKLVTLPVVWNNQEIALTKSLERNIKFTLRSISDHVAVWEDTIENCKVTYAPNIVLKTDRISTTTILDNNDKQMKTAIEFELGEELAPILELKPFFTNTNASDGYSINSGTNISINGKKVVLTLIVDRNTTIGSGDAFTFDLQIECVVSGTVWTYWQSNMFSNMSVSYNAVEKDVLYDDLILEQEGTETSTNTPIYSLRGIKKTSESWLDTSYNTLVIPAKVVGKTWVRYVGDKDENKTAIELPDHITKIKIAGIGVQEFRTNCFNGCNKVKYLDLSAITDAVQSLDSVLTFGTNSYANWDENGHIIWNSQISQYKKHIVKNKLYKAGLTGNSWFGIIEVSNLSQLKEAAYSGGTIKLTADIDITPTTSFTGQINFYESCILDLNGHTIEVVQRPIFNTAKAEFAVIGVWDCELLVCDSSTKHTGAIKAFDCSPVNHYDQVEGKKPEEDLDPTQLDPCTNKYWEWLPTSLASKAHWRIRENRTFYVRSDIPTRAKGTLEILGGNFWGNCTNIMNWNTTVYIEDGYSNRPKLEADYKGEGAPTFHLYSVYCSEDYPTCCYPTNPCHEFLNCKEDTCRSGVATFQVWGGKFYGARGFVTTTQSQSEAKWLYYDPKASTGDMVPDPEHSGKYKTADWTYNPDDPNNPCSHTCLDYQQSEISEDPGYTLMIPGDTYKHN